MFVSNNINSLPNELVTEVLALIASSSFTDFFNAKLSCKDFYETADDNYIFQQMSLEKFPIVSWHRSEVVSSFLIKCQESGNLEALYRQGVVEYFSFMKLDYGLECLKRAARSGHSGALYVLAIILLFSGDEFKQQGIQLLRGIQRSKVKRRMRDCREKLRAIIKSIWIRNALFHRQRPICCEMQHQHKRKKGWEREEDEDEDDDNIIQCEACQCDREVTYVCDMFPRV